MAEEIPGSLHVSNDVLAELANYAAMSCYGIVGMAAPSDIDDLEKIKAYARPNRGIVIEVLEEGVHIDLYVIVEYGTNIGTVARNLIDNVTYVLSEQAQVPVSGVEVHVQGIKIRK